MSKINDLIKELCPNGVRFDRLENVTLLQAGDRITTAMMSDDFDYDVIGGGTLPTGKYSDYNREQCITISRAGSAGYVNWMEDKFWATDVCFTATKNNEYMDIKFIYHYLKNAQKDLQQHLYGGSMPKLEKLFLWKYPIPIPPLEVQEEITRILDKFGELEAELKAELEARKSQYEFWREKLLNKKYDIKYLPELSINLDSKRKPVTKSDRELGEFPYYGASGIVDYVSNYIFDDELLLVSEDGANLKARSTPIAFSSSGKVWVNNHAHVLKFNSGITQKYVEHYLNMIDLTEYITGAAQPKLNQDNLNKIRINIPSSIEEQEKIVTALEKFNKLKNDIFDGLPGEIELRRKQYEYYRNKLLSFEEL